MFQTTDRNGNGAPRSLLSLAGEPAVRTAMRRPAAEAPSLNEVRRPAEPAPSPLTAALAEARLRAAVLDEAAPSAATAPRPEPRRERRRFWPRAAPAPLAEAPSAPPVAGPSPFWRPMIDPYAVVGAIFRARLLIAACTILGAVLGVLVALSTPKQYEGATELLVDPRDLKLTDRDLTGTGYLPSDATLAIVENQVRVLTSGNVLTKVVDQLNLAADPEFNGSRGEFSLGAAIGALRGLLSRGDDTGAEAGRAFTLAVNSLAAKLDVERGGKTFVVRVGVTTESGEKSALIANTMTAVFLETYGELQAGTAGRASEELTERLDELRAGVEEAERAVETFKSENDLVDAQGRLITEDEIVKLNDQLAVARARTLELDARAQSARAADPDSLLSGALPEGVASSIITELRAQYAALKSEADRLGVKLGPLHPELRAVEAQLAGAREQLAGELNRIVSSIQVELKRAVQLEQELASRLAQLKVRQGAISGDLVTLRQLEREATARRAVYESYLLRARETDEQQGINTANMSVISTATAPLDPVGPSRAATALSGLILGFLGGVGLAGAGGAVQSLRANTRQRQEPEPAAAAPPPADDPRASDDALSVEELRASLHALRQAVSELSEARVRHR